MNKSFGSTISVSIIHNDGEDFKVGANIETEVDGNKLNKSFDSSSDSLAEALDAVFDEAFDFINDMSSLTEQERRIRELEAENKKLKEKIKNYETDWINTKSYSPVKVSSLSNNDIENLNKIKNMFDKYNKKI